MRTVMIHVGLWQLQELLAVYTPDAKDAGQDVGNPPSHFQYGSQEVFWYGTDPYCA